MKWSIRYASEKLGIALPSSPRPEQLSDEHKAMLNPVINALNATPLKFMRSNGTPKYSPFGGDDKGFDFKKMISSEDWEGVWRSSSGLVPTPETEDALNNSTSLIQSAFKNVLDVNHPVRRLYTSIDKFVGGTDSTLNSNEEIGPHKELLYAINNAPTQNVPKLHRGMRLGQEDLDKLTVGSNIDYDVSSWSADPTIARAFAEKPVNWNRDKQHKVILHLPAQSKALQIAGVNGHNNSTMQEEWLSARDSHEITDHQVDEDGVHHVYLKQKGVGMEMNEDDNFQLKLQKSWQQDWINKARRAQEPAMTAERIEELKKGLRL
jgi:hypothetical protein